MSDRSRRLVWGVCLGILGLLLLGRALVAPDGMGKVYVTDRVISSSTGPDEVEIRWTVEEPATFRDELLRRQGDPRESAVHLSVGRTIGLWIAAFLTLCIFSFLYGDNPFYKLAEAIFIGASAAYWMVVAFWNVLVPNLLARLLPHTIQRTLMPGLEGDDLKVHWSYLVPLSLSVMLLWRLAPRGQWIARWPLALFIGVFAGLRLVQVFHADFLNQIAAASAPLIVHSTGPDGATGLNWSATVAALISVVGVLCCLTYFFFSVEHRGAVGRAARVGIWVLMITFGAMFAYTVMGRIVLLVARIEFLLNDWLWLIDPAGIRRL
jgi:hypothetical protein